MKTSHLVLSLAASAGLVLALAGEASAKGACVYVKNESFQCADAVSSSQACKKKAPGGLGEYHDGTTCKRIGFDQTWGLASPPPPPAKPDLSPVSFDLKSGDVPPIPAPDAKKRKARF